MSDNKSDLGKSAVQVIDPETGKLLGRIFLIGDLVPTSEWFGSSGHLQNFNIVEGERRLRQAWENQEEVLLRTDYGQRFIKFVTYPTEGENQGYLDYTSELEPAPKSSSGQKNRLLTQRSIAFLQSLFST